MFQLAKADTNVGLSRKHSCIKQFFKKRGRIVLKYAAGTLWQLRLMLNGVLGLLQSIKIFKKILFLVAQDVHVCPWAFPGFGERGLLSSCCAQPLISELLLLQSSGPRHTGFSSRGAWAQLLQDMWDLPGSGMEPVSLALAGRFLSTATREVQSIETD